MEREWVTREELSAWIVERLAALEDCVSCDNSAKRNDVGFIRLLELSKDGGNWVDNSPFNRCYHQCRGSREMVIGEAVAKFNIKWD